jgi:predicted alpha/beta superfamily hydrolase
MIYTPKEYADTTKKFEVVYVFDAQQQEIFDAVHSTIAFQNYGLRPMIVVGIVSENRNKDFLPKNNHPETMQELAGQLGNANYLSDFLEKTLFTYIDKNYRTLPIKIGIGYSNGGTFLNYVMLTNPKLFNVIFSIDANFTYDKGQLVESIKNNTSLSQSNLFYYTCQTPTGENWVNSSKEFNSSLIKNANMIIKQDFFQRETHSSVYQQGVINAFKEYFRYQFFNSKNLIDYFKKFDQNGQYSLSTREINSIAKVYLKNGLAEDAKKILLSFQYKILDDIENQNDLYELFDSGDLYMNLGFTDIAKKYFLVCQKKLEANKNQISADFYNFGKNKIKEKLKLIENNKQ